MEEWDDSARREEALRYFVSSIYREMGASDEAVERARRLSAVHPLARCVTFCYTDEDRISVGCVRMSVDWGAYRHYCRQRLSVPEDYRKAYEAEASEILRLIGEYFAGCRVKTYVAHDEAKTIWRGDTNHIDYGVGGIADVSGDGFLGCRRREHCFAY